MQYAWIPRVSCIAARVSLSDSDEEANVSVSMAGTEPARNAEASDSVSMAGTEPAKNVEANISVSMAETEPVASPGDVEAKVSVSMVGGAAKEKEIPSVPASSASVFVPMNAWTDVSGLESLPRGWVRSELITVGDGTGHLSMADKEKIIIACGGARASARARNNKRWGWKNQTVYRGPRGVAGEGDRYGDRLNSCG